MKTVLEFVFLIIALVIVYRSQRSLTRYEQRMSQLLERLRQPASR